MHSTDIGDVTFHHNGDFSGDVKIDVSAYNVVLVQTSMPGVPGVFEIEIPFDALKGLVAEYVRGQLIEELEQDSADDVLMGRVSGCGSAGGVTSNASLIAALQTLHQRWMERANSGHRNLDIESALIALEVVISTGGGT